VRPLALPHPGPGPLAASPEGNAWPTAVVEVAFSDTLGDLIADAQMWLGPQTACHLFIGIKLYKRCADGTAPFVALLFQRANPVVPTSAISFGTAPIHHTTLHTINALGGARVVGHGCGGPGCDGAGLSLYQLQVPTVSLFHPLPVPAPLPPVIPVDLFVVQQRILHEML